MEDNFDFEEIRYDPNRNYADLIRERKQAVEQFLVDDPSDVVKRMTYYSHDAMVQGARACLPNYEYSRKHEFKPGRNYAFLSCANAFGEIFSAPFFFEAKDEVFYYCLRGNGDVELADGTCKKVSDLTVGDRVQSVSQSNGAMESSEIVARSISRQRNHVPGDCDSCASAPFEFVCIGQTWVTPEHPIRIEGHWRRPNELGEKVAIAEENAVYNFVLSNRSSLFVNGLEVATLGQFCEGIDDLGSFFGSERVVHHLQMDPQWPNVVI
jgi:hypothetical protein